MEPERTNRSLSHRILVLSNPQSRRYRARLVDTVIATIEAGGREAIRLETFADVDRTVEAVEHLMQQYPSEITDAVVIGGDGTLHLAVNALVGHRVAIGYIPSGTGNDFSRGFFGKRYNDQSDAKWIAQALHGELVTIDLGQINQRYFVNVAGIGFDARVVQQLRGKKGWFPSVRYVGAALRSLFFEKANTIELAGSSQKLLALSRRPCFMLNFANGPYFGNGMQIAPHANFHDGSLAYCYIENAGFWKKLLAFKRLYQGRHIDFREVHCGQFHAVQVVTPGLPIEADGEWLGETPAFVRTLPAALSIRRASA